MILIWNICSSVNFLTNGIKDFNFIYRIVFVAVLNEKVICCWIWVNSNAFWKWRFFYGIKAVVWWFCKIFAFIFVGNSNRIRKRKRWFTINYFCGITRVPLIGIGLCTSRSFTYNRGLRNLKNGNRDNLEREKRNCKYQRWNLQKRTVEIGNENGANATASKCQLVGFCVIVTCDTKKRTLYKDPRKYLFK